MAFSTEDALTAVGLFAATTRDVAAKDLELARGTADGFVKTVLHKVAHWLEDPKLRDVLPDTYAEGVWTKLVQHYAARPQLGLADAGEHLRFAEAWSAFISLYIACKTGHIGDLDNIAIIACSMLADWAKTGYRLDWHPFDSDTKTPSPSAPVGSWTQKKTS